MPLHNFILPKPDTNSTVFDFLVIFCSFYVYSLVPGVWHLESRGVWHAPSESFKIPINLKFYWHSFFPHCGVSFLASQPIIRSLPTAHHREVCDYYEQRRELPLPVYHNFIQFYRRFLTFITAQYINPPSTPPTVL